LGIGNECDYALPQLVKSLENQRIIGISCATNHSIAFTKTKVFSWGDAKYGKLGHGMTNKSWISKDIFLPTQVQPLYCSIKKAVSNNYSSHILTNDQNMYSWGLADVRKRHFQNNFVIIMMSLKNLDLFCASLSST
jgi:hypothetical protein